MQGKTEEDMQYLQYEQRGICGYKKICTGSIKKNKEICREEEELQLRHYHNSIKQNQNQDRS
jgi:predicted class III extradiol MEMO1 family dioxygenase